MPFTANVGKTDRIIRIIIAILLFIISIVVSGWLRIILIIIGIMLLITTVTRFCGLYKLLGINTSNLKPKS